MARLSNISILISIIIFILSSGCSSTNVKIKSESYWASNGQRESKEIGVSLAGGGTKAASFSMGVLSALAKEGMMWDVDAISTVSGGSYAGLFLYSRLISDNDLGHLSPEKTKSYFRDCIPISYSKEGSAHPPFNNYVLDFLEDSFCKRGNNTAPQLSLNKQYLQQQYVRCSQDIAVKGCAFTTTAKDNSIIMEAAGLSVGTFLSLPLSLTANTLFDWPFNISPSMYAYKEGMGVAYAMRPTGSNVLTRKNKSTFCETSYSNCSLIKGATKYDLPTVTLDPKKRQSFSDLAKLYENEVHPPIWMLNATSAPSRSIFGWLSRNQTDMQRYTFSMSPFKQGSSQYGDIALEENNVDLLSAATASAAFFDANQTVLDQPLKSVVGVGQHLLNLNWGIDIPNPTASKTRRIVRSLIPFPLYYMDYWAFKQPAYVRLLDGGSSDNLGAYRLIVDGFKDVVISDHAQDVDGRMSDLCLLRNELLLRNGLYLHMPGLEDWPKPCASVAKRSMKDNRLVKKLFEDMTESERKENYYYPVHAWPYPFLAGCVSKSSKYQSCFNYQEIQKVWLIKPAIDFSYFYKEQLDNKNGLVKACNNRERFFLPCETSGFLVNNFGANYENEYGFPIFPQHETVAMTMDSSSTLYGAYRELAESYTSIVLEALQKVKKNPIYFENIIKAQEKYKIRHSPKKEILNRNRKNGDIANNDWGLEVRNKARRALGKLIH